MYSFSPASRKNLDECHPDLQMIMHRAIEIVDFSIICGHRNKEDQNAAYDAGTSKLKWPGSSHNIFPSNACDAIPYPVDWDDKTGFYFLAGVITACADQFGIPIVWGGTYENFFDGPHYELKK